MFFLKKIIPYYILLFLPLIVKPQNINAPPNNSFNTINQSISNYDATAITYQDGLPLNYTRDLIQDSTGLIWISNRYAGLQVYDGKQIQTYNKYNLDRYLPVHRATQAELGSNGNIYFIDWTTKIWEFNPYSRQLVGQYEQDSIATKHKIYDFKINEKMGIWLVTYPFADGDFFYLMRADENDILRLIDTVPFRDYPQLLLTEDLVYVTADEAIRTYNQNGQLMAEYALTDPGKEVFPYDLSIDEEQNVWVKSSCFQEEPYKSCAIFTLKKGENRFKKWQPKGNLNLDNTFLVKPIKEEVWIGGYYHRLLRYHISTGETTDFSQQIGGVIQSSTSYLNGIIPLPSGEIWLPHYDGLAKLSPQKSTTFRHLFHTQSAFCQNNCTVKSVTGNGNTIYFAFTNRIIEFNEKTNEANILPINVNLKQKGTNKLLFFDIGYKGFHFLDNQLYWNDWAIDLKTKNSQILLPNKADFRVINFIDEEQTLWLMPQFSPLSNPLIYLYDLKNKTSDSLALPIQPIENDPVFQIEISRKNKRLWVLYQQNGLMEFDLKGDLIYHYPLENINQQITQRTNTLYRENNKILWLGHSRGILEINTETREMFYHSNIFLNSEGLQQNPATHSILAGHQNNLWVGTHNGLFRFDKTTKRFSNQHLPYSLRFPEFSRSAVWEAESGKMYFGSTDGVYVFHPNEIAVNAPSSNAFSIALTQFAVYNTQRDSTYVQLSNLAKLKEIYLKPTDTWFSLRFALPDFQESDKILYSYFLEGNDEDWSDLSLNNQLRYNQLPYGDYVLYIKAGKSRPEMEQNILSIPIHVAQIWYKKWWAIALFALLVLGLIISVYFYQLNHRLEQREALRIKELDRVKNQFFTNITHEFRTPLTVIMGMNDNIKGHPKERGLIQRNAKNLLRLINQLLDLSKLEAGHLSLDYTHGNVVNYLQYLTESFYSLATDKNIRLTFYSEEQQIFMDYDEEKLQHIVYNLLSNAIKFTEEEGKVIFHVLKTEKEGQAWLKMKIKDTGQGIEADKLPYIFDRFYQANQEDKFRSDENIKGNPTGTGIGLALTKELVELMQGNISVKSKVAKGTEFIIDLPIKREHQTLIGSSNKVISTIPNKETVPPETGNSLNASTISKNDAPELLIIEDNKDVRIYIQTLLEKDYKIRIARNGAEGIQQAIEHIPDIIISDVMMPKKDGFEVCAALKQDERTSHIPIILLTAKATHEAKIQGLRFGADAYLTKPFQKDELLIRLEKLVEIRRQLQAHYSDQETSKKVKALQAFSPLNTEDLFLQKLHDIVHSQLDNYEFKPNDLAKAALLSPTQLYRKLKALTGKTPSQFIRSIRLKKGKELLLNSDRNISEIAYDVGFADPNYFSRMFQKEFGKSPREFR